MKRGRVKGTHPRRTEAESDEPRRADNDMRTVLEADLRSRVPGTQTLMRGLDMIEALDDRALTLDDLVQRFGLTRSTTQRLLNALVDRGFLALTPRSGYRLGPKLILLGALAQKQADLVQVARPYLEALAGLTEDTVSLAVDDGDFAVCIDKIAGRRRIMISSPVGDRQRLTSTGIGKALLLDSSSDVWLARFETDRRAGGPAMERKVWQKQMLEYVRSGVAYDIEENEHQIRGVAAPVRDVSGKIVAAISVSGAAQYMQVARMTELANVVRESAQAISRALGFRPRAR